MANTNQELVLKLKRNELFDPIVLSPHSEINSDIYNAVENFTTRTKNISNLKITIFSPTIGKAIQEKFKELFFEHYKDEEDRIKIKIKAVSIKTIVLVLLALIILFVWFKLSNTILRELFGTLWAFNVWEASHTFIEALEAIHKKRRIISIKNAIIEFIDI